MSYLKDYRKFKQWSVEELAASLKCSPSLIVSCESGRRRITPDKAMEWEKRTKGELQRQKLVPEFFIGL